VAKILLKTNEQKPQDIQFSSLQEVRLPLSGSDSSEVAKLCSGIGISLL